METTVLTGPQKVSLPISLEADFDGDDDMPDLIYSPPQRRLSLLHYAATHIRYNPRLWTAPCNGYFDGDEGLPPRKDQKKPKSR